MKGRDLIKAKALWSIGSGNNVNIWEDPWLPNHLNLTRYKVDDYTRVSDLIDHDAKSWKRDRLCSIFPKNIQDCVLAIHLPFSHLEDIIVWPCTKDGAYSVKSGYKVALEIKSTVKHDFLDVASSSRDFPPSLWNLIWSANVPSKIKVFLWKACKNGLPTMENLHKRKCKKSPICNICCSDIETVEHTILLCPWTRRFWCASPLQCAINPNLLSRFYDWFHSIIDQCCLAGYGKNEAVTKVRVCCWQVWKGRCQASPEGKEVALDQVLKQMYISLNELFHHNQAVMSNSVSCHRSATMAPTSWTPPPRNQIKINVDAAFCETRKTAACAFICRNSQGSLIHGQAITCHCSNAFEAQAFALRNACQFAPCFSSITIECDAEAVLKAINSPKLASWRARSLLEDIKKIVADSPSIRLHCIRRTANCSTDWVAKSKLRDSLPLDWISNVPSQLYNLLLTDFLPTGVG